MSTTHRLPWTVAAFAAALLGASFGGCAHGCQPQRAKVETPRHPFASTTVGRAEETREAPTPRPVCTKPSDLLATGTKTKRVKIQSSGTQWLVELEATPELPDAWLTYLSARLEIVPQKSAGSEDEPVSRIVEPMGLQRGRSEIALSLVSPERASAKLAWKWPSGFELVRPGVVAPAAVYSGLPQEPASVAQLVAETTVSGPTTKKTLLCQPTSEEALPIPFAEIRVSDWSGVTDADGAIHVPDELLASGSFDVVYEGTVAGGDLQIMNDVHSTRSDSIPGDWIVRTLDCELWVLGAQGLQAFQALRGEPPPAGGLRVHRWTAVSMVVPYAPYDHVSIGTNFLITDRSDRRRVIFHELGHTVAFVADGNWLHWLNDATKWRYARIHQTTGITSEPFAWSEGWATFWGCSRHVEYEGLPGGVPANPGATPDCPGIGPSHPPPEFIDWNQDRVAVRLGELANDIADPYQEMVALLEGNQGQIHSLWEFEKAYCAAFPSSSHCDNGVPTRVKEACPPGFSAAGLLCERHEAEPKPSQGRGAGVPPIGCEEELEEGIALCYAACDEGYDGVGPVCWEQCPEGYDGGGAFCRRDVEIIQADNSSCPWYDKCGLTFAAGCSTCPEDYTNDGCTCRKPAHIYPKDTRPRGAGTLPTDCPEGMEYDAGLCYPSCPDGFNGVGPVCWGQCPDLYQDWGASCHFITSFAKYDGS